MTARLLAISCCMLLTSGVLGKAEPPLQTGQMCWAYGRYDRTVYYASIENREDRSGSFLELLRISGIEATEFKCLVHPLAQHRAFAREKIESWRRTELEIINTTFLSDLDY
jgi:hypothetical protein